MKFHCFIILQYRKVSIKNTSHSLWINFKILYSNRNSQSQLIHLDQCCKESGLRTGFRGLSKDFHMQWYCIILIQCLSTHSTLNICLKILNGFISQWNLLIRKQGHLSGKAVAIAPAVMWIKLDKKGPQTKKNITESFRDQTHNLQCAMQALSLTHCAT